MKSGNEFAKKVVIASESKPWMKGDVNEDGKVDISDVVALIDMVLGNAPTMSIGDINGDGIVGIDDVSDLIDELLM